MFRVTTWWHVCAYGLVITAIAAAMPYLVLFHMLGWLPEFLVFGMSFVSSTLLASIALPLALIALSSVRRVNLTVDSLDRLIKYDPMTGLMARTHFLHQAEQHRGEKGYLVIVDADRFKSINDTYGHEAGDLALKYIASCMMQVIGGHGFIGRLGGEEFAIRLPRMKQSQAELIMATLGTKLRSEAFQYGAHHLIPTVSAGIVFENGKQPIASLLRIADECLYRAKSEGRDRFIFDINVETSFSQVA